MRPSPPESIHSDCSTLSSSPGKSRSRTYSELKHAFPSIYASMTLMKRHYEKKNLSDWRTVALVFLSTYQSILAETARFPGVGSSDHDLEECRACGVDLGKALERHLQSLATRHDPEALTLAFEHVKMTLAALEHLYQLSILRSREKKLLPDLPAVEEGSDSGSVYHDAVSAIQNEPSTPPAGPSPSIITQSASMDSGSSITLVHSSVASFAQQTPPQSTVRIVPKSKVEGVSNPPASKTGNTSRMCRKVVRPFYPQHDLPSYMLEEYECVVEGFSYVRRSTIYMPSDPRLQPNDPKPPFQGLLFNTDGKPNAGSISGFIRLLSSSQGIADPNLLNTLFTCFRDFTTPQDFFLHLQARFEEGSAQEDFRDNRALQIEHHAVRVRTLKLLLYWLDRHWKPGSDNDVLPDIKHFLQHCTQGVVPADANIMVLLRQRIAAIENPPSSNEPQLQKPKHKVPRSPVKKNMIKHRADPVIQLLAFNSEKNCRALSQQITLMISGMYQRVHPTDMASFWGLGPDEKKQYERRKATDSVVQNVLKVRDFEEALAIWVTYIILKPHDEEQRIQLVSMWLNVAICCLDDRNYSSAFCIFNGVAHHAVRRMRDTVVRVPRASKGHYHRLERFFSGRGNYSQVRSGMNNTNNNTQAIVPLSAVLKHDMGVSRAVHPKTIDVKNDQEEQTELINLTGYEVMAKTVRTLRYCIPYPFAEDQPTRDWLSGELNRFSDFTRVEEFHKMLEERSLKRQPAFKGADRSYDPWQRVREKDMIVPLNPEEMAQGSSNVLRTGLAKSIKSLGLRQAAINLATRSSPR